MRTLYIKYVVLTIGIMLFSGVLAFILSNSYYQQKLKPENDEKVTDIAHSVTEYVEANPMVHLHDYLENISSIGYQMYLVDSNGEENFFGAAFRDQELSKSTIESVFEEEVYHGIFHFPQETFVTGFFANELKNTIGVPLTHGDSEYALFIRPDIKLLFNEMHFLFAWLLALTIILSIVMVAFSTKFLVKPLSQLTKATKSLAEGNYGVELDINRRDELGELSQSFLQMAKQLEQTDETRKEFIANLSHDIQSPLSNIKGYTNLLDTATISLKDKNEYIAVINNETERLSNLTEQLLLLASLDRREDLLEKKLYNVGVQLKELLRNYQWQASEKDIMFNYSLPDIEINGDLSLLYAVWDNLLVNAIKYNKVGGSVRITLKKKVESVIITFTDTGIGLKGEELERVFDRFYRADASRTRTVEGTGLGLSIVWTIVKLHNGKIDVASHKDEGTVFTVTLPIDE